MSKRDRVGGRQALHLAAQSGCCGAIVYLVKLQRIFVDVKSSEFGDTPLHLAAKVFYISSFSCFEFNFFQVLNIIS